MWWCWHPWMHRSCYSKMECGQETKDCAVYCAFYDRKNNILMRHYWLTVWRHDAQQQSCVSVWCAGSAISNLSYLLRILLSCRHWPCYLGTLPQVTPLVFLARKRQWNLVKLAEYLLNTKRAMEYQPLLYEVNYSISHIKTLLSNFILFEFLQKKRLPFWMSLAW